MSLLVWLPLNGNFTNNGTTYFEDFVLPSNASWSAGKLGNNLNISNASTRRTITKLSNLKEFSISLWYKMEPDKTYTQWRDVIMVTDSINEFRLETVNTAGTATSWYGYGMNASGTGHIAVTTGIWYHDTVVVSGRIIKRYINGNLQSTTTSENDCQLAGDLRLGDAGMYCQIADVRIYDHCLSKKEVKELSKGLVCHYPLKSSYGGQDNLFKASVAIGQSNCTVDKSQASGYLIKLPSTSGLSIFSSKDLITNGVFSSSDYGKTFTVSFTAWADANTNLASDLNPDTYGGSLGMPNDTAVINVFTTPTRLVYTGTITNSSGAMVNNTIFRFWHYGSDKGYNNTNIYITDIKVEVGNKVTSWCPNASDNNYMSSNIEYDTSGYCNHGTKSGTIIYNSDTPRYSVSTVFDGTSSGIEIQSSVFPVVLNGPFTVSMWVYDQETGGRSIFFGNWNLTGAFFNIEKEANNKARFYWNANPDFHCTNSPIAANAWTHLVMTRDGNTVKCYINGVLTDTSTATLSGTVPTNATIFRLGRDGRSDATMFKGRMSDFRLYATVLSESDIKELYNQPISFNKHSTMIQGEFIEK